MGLARHDDRTAFEESVEPYRQQLRLHCYRMLGSFHEAEDLVQETFLRAWRARGRFEGRTSLRNWLYRIATNACLNALAARPSAVRLLPTSYGPPTDDFPEGPRPDDVPWLQPYPDWALEGIADPELGPEVQYELQESVQLAFVAAIQRLPPRQRAVLLLRDVLGWTAAEAAVLLDTSSVSVNSALQRARATLASHLPAQEWAAPAPADETQRALLERYVAAWQAADIDRFVAVLREDAILSMPPWPHWYQGRESIARFFSWAWARRRALQIVPTSANRQPAFVQYAHLHDDVRLELHSVQVLTLSAQADAITAITVFLSRDVIDSFKMPRFLEA